jgi:hypothetical protein
MSSLSLDERVVTLGDGEQTEKGGTRGPAPCLRRELGKLIYASDVGCSAIVP